MVAVVACANVTTASPRSRYDIDPRELVCVQREAHERGLEIVGFYHSHPDHSSQWSATDLHDAHWIGCSYLITSVIGGKARQTSSFRLQGSLEEDKHFVEEKIQVES